MVSELLVGGLAVAALLCLSAFFSASEIAVFSLQSHRVEAMAATGGPGTATLARLREDPHRLLVTVLVGNNVVNVAIASVVTALLVARFSAGVGAVVATVVVSTLVLLFGEIAPKSYGLGNAESVARRAAGPLRLVQRLLLPVVVVFDAANGAFTRLVGGSPDIERPFVTRADVAALVATAEEHGAIDAGEQALVGRALAFGDVPVRRVMVPRADVDAVPETATVGAAVDACVAARRSRLPVYREDPERVVGYVDLRDLVGADRDAGVDEFLLPVLHAFEGRAADDLLAEFRAERLEVAIVFDEFGAVEGIVTAEDLVEALVGDVFDVDEPRDVVRVDDRTVSARGVAPVAAVAERLGVDLPAPESGTVAALLVDRLGRVPERGESVAVGGATFTVRSVADDRVLRVLVERDGPAGDARDDGSGGATREDASAGGDGADGSE